MNFFRHGTLGLLCPSLSLIILTSCATTPSEEELATSELTPKEVDAELAAQYAYLAMMASNSYHNDERDHFEFKTLGWEQVYPDGESTSGASVSHWFTGLAYDIYENKSKNRVVFAFRGSEGGLRDWLFGNLSIGVSPQYKQAKKEFKEYKDAHEGMSYMVTGHSLGGGLALSVSLHEGVDAVIFNPSPRRFDGMKDANEKAKRISISQKGEPLEVVRKFWRKFKKVLKAEDIYQTSCEGKSHRMDKLANCLLDKGKSVNDDLNGVSVVEGKA